MATLQNEILLDLIRFYFLGRDAPIAIFVWVGGFYGNFKHWLWIWMLAITSVV